MTRICISLLLIVLTAACVPQSGALVSNDTGVAGRFSAQAVISDHAHHVLYGHVIEATRDDETVRALVISQRRDGVHNLRIREAWMEGVELPFTRAGGLDGCSHGHCLNRHTGMIILSDALFADAAANGMRARLIGGQDSVTIAAPPRLFQLSLP